jgi:hypothetical protein
MRLDRLQTQTGNFGEESAATAGNDIKIGWSCSTQPGDCDDSTILATLVTHNSCWMSWTFLCKYKQGLTRAMQFKGTNKGVYHNTTICSKFWQEKVHCLVNYSVELLGVRHLCHLSSYYSECCQNSHHTSTYCSVWLHVTYMCFLAAGCC